MITFFHSPGSCSEGIQFLLKAIGAEFETRVVNVSKGDQKTPEYLAENPKGKVPAIRREDGTVLTEYPAIAYWLGQTYPQSGVWPKDLDAQARVLETMDFIVGTIHMRGFTLMRVPQKFLADPAGQTALRAHGRDVVANGLKILSETMGKKDYLLGDFSLADTAFFYVMRWAVDEGFDIPDNLQACFDRLQARVAA